MEATVYLFSISLRPPAGSQFKIHFDRTAESTHDHMDSDFPIYQGKALRRYRDRFLMAAWYRNTLILNFNAKIYRSKLHRAEDYLGWLSIIS